MPPENLSLRQHFIYRDVGAKCLKATCIHCDTYKDLAKNPTREQKHVDVDCPVLKAIRQSEGSNPTAKRQRTLTDSFASPVSGARKAQIDKELAMCLYQTGRPLSMFEDNCWIEFFKKNFGYTPPSTEALSNPLLEDVYSNVKAQVKSKIQSSPYLGIITDESTNINTNRIINTSVVTSSGDSYYWSNIEAKEGTLGAKELADHTIKQAREIMDNDFSRWASTSTDTCTTMLAFADRFEQNPETKHVIAVPCDSHGLQLLIQDILLRPCIKMFWNEATDVIAAFKKAPKQYHHLRLEQEKRYKTRKNVIVAGKTRWGTQVGALQSLENTKEALREFAFRRDVDIKHKDKIILATWWANNTDLLAILEPIHELQKMSEDNKANISYVLPRWLQVELHLIDIANSPNIFAKDIREYLDEVGTEMKGNRKVEKRGWTRRKNRQLRPIHTAAYFLHPDNYHVPITTEQKAQLQKDFKRFTPDYNKALEQFLDFRDRTNSFGEAGGSWELTKNPVLFWRYLQSSAPELSLFARKVLTVIANSVPSERAFSTMNYIHSKTRNRLDLIRTDKLQFIFMNIRALSKQAYPQPSLEDLLALEDEILLYCEA
jgi:hypothetical protein